MESNQKNKQIHKANLEKFHHFRMPFNGTTTLAYNILSCFRYHKFLTLHLAKGSSINFLKKEGVEYLKGSFVLGFPSQNMFLSLGYQNKTVSKYQKRKIFSLSEHGTLCLLARETVLFSRQYQMRQDENKRNAKSQERSIFLEVCFQFGQSISCK